jgi:hypothetical protein
MMAKRRPCGTSPQGLRLGAEDLAELLPKQLRVLKPDLEEFIVNRPVPHSRSEFHVSSISLISPLFSMWSAGEIEWSSADRLLRQMLRSRDLDLAWFRFFSERNDHAQHTVVVVSADRLGIHSFSEAELA